MKKKIILVFSVLAVVGSSCKKTRSCHCDSVSTTTYTDQWNTTVYTGYAFKNKTQTKQYKKEFVKENECYNTTTKIADSGQGWKSETIIKNSCTLK